MNDATRRSLRTLMQTSFAAAVIAMLASFGIINWTSMQTTFVMAVLTPVFGFLQNMLEDRGAIPPILKHQVVS